MRALETCDPATLRRELEPGEPMVVTMSDGARFDLEFVSVDEEALVGRHPKGPREGAKIRLSCSELSSVEIERVDQDSVKGWSFIFAVALASMLLAA